MGMILRIASSRIVGQGDIVGRSGYFSLNLSANSVMRGRLDARRTLKSLVADLRFFKSTRRFFLFLMEEAAVFLWYGLLGRLSSSHRIYVFSLMSMWLPSDKFTVSLRWVSFIT